MNDFFLFLDETKLAIYLRESDFGFPVALAMHTLGLSLIMGPNGIVSMRLLGLASGIPLQPLRKLFPLMWAGLILAAISGAALGIGHASTRLQNPIMAVKLLIIAVAAPIMWKMQTKLFDDPKFAAGGIPDGARTIAISQLVLWMAVMVVGRLIAYSATILGIGY